MYYRWVEKNMESIIKIEHISKIYNLYDKQSDRLKEILGFKGKKRYKESYALKDISFEVYKGETVGIIGTNGSGKSTLLKIITGVLNQTSGTVHVGGKVSALLELGAGFNPEYTGIENIYLNGTMMKYTDAEIDERLQNIIDFADIGEYIYQPVKTYSSGMFARLAFAVAINVEPDILIVDEALSVGDVFFQNKCFRKFEELKRQGVTILFVSHDIESVKAMTSRVLWIEHGEQKMFGDKIEVCNEYLKMMLLENNTLASGSGNEDKSLYEVKKIKLENYPWIKTRNGDLLHDDVKIISCFAENENGEISYDLKSGQRYMISVIFETKIDIPDCIVGFVLQNKKGVSIINTNTLLLDQKKNFYAKKDSVIRVNFDFEVPLLHTDEYIVDCAVAGGKNVMDNTMYTWRYGAMNVYITNPGGNMAMLDIDAKVTIYEQES